MEILKALNMFKKQPELLNRIIDLYNKVITHIETTDINTIFSFVESAVDQRIEYQSQEVSDTNKPCKNIFHLIG